MKKILSIVLFALIISNNAYSSFFYKNQSFRGSMQCVGNCEIDAVNVHENFLANGNIRFKNLIVKGSTSISGNVNKAKDSQFNDISVIGNIEGKRLRFNNLTVMGRAKLKKVKGERINVSGILYLKNSTVSYVKCNCNYSVIKRSNVNEMAVSYTDNKEQAAPIIRISSGSKVLSIVFAGKPGIVTLDDMSYLPKVTNGKITRITVSP